jgi:hypothetical protein
MGGRGARRRNPDHLRPQKCPQRNARVGRDAHNIARNRSGRSPRDPVLRGLSAAGLYDIVDDVPARWAPAERPAEAEELLTDLLFVLFGLRADTWPAFAAAIPVELQERIAPPSSLPCLPY